MSIPVRNIWLLMLYASDLGKAATPTKLAAEDLLKRSPIWLPRSWPRLWSSDSGANSQPHSCPEKRCSPGCGAESITSPPAAGSCWPKGRWPAASRSSRSIARAIATCVPALDAAGRLVRKPELAHRCRRLAHGLRLQRVIWEPLTRLQISSERFGRHDQADQPMLAAARLAMDLALPTEEAGPNALIDPERCVHWMRRLYEKAIGGFYRLSRVKPLGRRRST